MMTFIPYMARTGIAKRNATDVYTTNPIASSLSASILSTICLLRSRPMPATRTVRRAAFVALTLAAPISGQAALPSSLAQAVSQAGLAPSDISILVVPVGTPERSRLPEAIAVDEDIDEDVDVTQDQALETEALTQTPTSDEVTSSSSRTDHGVQPTQSLSTYTDDPYTHLSLDAGSATAPTPSNDHSGAHHARAYESAATSTNNTGDKHRTASSSLPASTTAAMHDPLLRHYSETPRTPASTMKLIPSLIALDTLGADFVWHTRVYHTGLIVADRLEGDLIIQGSGDPKLTHQRLYQLLYEVKKAGIRHVTGDIILDSAIFSQVAKDPAAFDSAPLRPYNASPDGFLVNFNTLAIHSNLTDDGRAILTYKPKLADYQLPEQVTTRAGNCTVASRSLAPTWQADRLALGASLPIGCDDHVFYVAHPDPKAFSARVVAAWWQRLGNTLDGRVIAQETPYSAHTNSHTSSQTSSASANTIGVVQQFLSPLPIASYPSRDLAQQLYDINHYSNNVMTEQLTLSIAAYGQTHSADQAQAHHEATSLYTFGAPKTIDYPQALENMDHWWRTHLHSSPPYLTNGSGLCRACKVTAANLSELLVYAYAHPSFATYVNSLGVAGVSGTIATHRERLPQSTAIGRAWIKTGTLSDVTSMAGYVKGLSGQDYVVVGIINTKEDLNPYRARPVLDTLLDWTARH